MQHLELPFLLFRVAGGLYAIASGCVREIVRLPEVARIPNASPEFRGVMNLRGKVLKLIDLRIKLGLPPLSAEADALAQLLCEREQDHRNWLAELEACIRERRPFQLQRDPHKCKFGQWYDQYKTRDRLLGMTLPSMDKPHKVIHATAEEALKRAECGDNKGALELIAARRDLELAALIRLFAESRRVLDEGQRELAIVLSRGLDHLAFSADLVEDVERIPEERIEPMPAQMACLHGGLCSRVGRRPRSEQTVLFLNEDLFFSSGKLHEARQEDEIPLVRE